MKTVLYSRPSRDRIPELQICTSIIEEDGKKYVLKSAGHPNAKKYLRSFERNYKILKDIFVEKINIVDCVIVDESTVRFEFVEGKTFTEVLVELYRANEVQKATELINSFFELIVSSSTEDIMPYKRFFDVLGGFSCSKPLKGISSACFDMYFNNIVLDDDGGFHYFDYECDFDCLIPVNYIVFRSMQLLRLIGGVDDDFARQILEKFEIDNEQTEIYQKMESAFISYVKPVAHPYSIFEYNNILGRENAIHDLNCLDVNNPKVFPDYGSGYSEDTKKVCLDFDFRTGRLDMTVAFEKAPERIRFDPVDRLYCTVSDTKITANGKELPIAWHNGSDFNGVMLFDSIDSNIYYENPERARVFTITANIAAFNDEKHLNALKTAQRINIEHASLQQQFAELQVFERQTQGELTQTQELLTQTKDQLAQTCQQLDEANSEIQTLTSLKAAAEENAREMKATAEQWRASYEIITNSCFWKITYPFRKLLDVLKSIFRKKK